MKAKCDDQNERCGTTEQGKDINHQKDYALRLRHDDMKWLNHITPGKEHLFGRHRSTNREFISGFFSTTASLARPAGLVNPESLETSEPSRRLDEAPQFYSTCVKPGTGCGYVPSARGMTGGLASHA